MSNNIVEKAHGIGLSNAACLDMAAAENFYACYDSAREAGERLFQAASLLPEGEYLGWQISFDIKGDHIIRCFARSAGRVTDDDYNWIFQNCGAVGSDASDAPADSFDLFKENRTVYVLENTYTERNYPEKHEPNSEHCADLYGMLKDNGGILRIIAGGGSADPARSAVLLSLPQEISLRARTMLARCFRNTQATELQDGKDSPLIEFPPLLCLKGAMTGLLQILMCKSFSGSVSEHDFDYPLDDGIFEGTVADDIKSENAENAFTPIEELDLSIRSYTCLKRAGISSVERLRSMNDDELMKVRNLGRKSLAEIKDKLASQTIGKIVPLQAPDYMSMLNELIGLKEVKEQIERIAALVKMQKDTPVKGNDGIPVSLNMEFVGNPGTAKTTVARITAGIFNEIGLLPSNELIEVGRADLVAKYEGQTADKVKDIFRRAKGKLLFIDEAYSLVENWEGEYGDEAINTIVQEMENNRQDTIVIFAGYPDKMESFFSRNPGLRSRVPFRISFSDYSEEELLQIAELEAKKRGFSISPSAHEKMRDAFHIAARQPQLGNGRFCRNLIENAVLNYALRVYSGEDGAEDKDFVLTAADFTFPEVLHDTVKQTLPIGFRI